MFKSYFEISFCIHQKLDNFSQCLTKRSHHRTHCCCCGGGDRYYFNNTKGRTRLVRLAVDLLWICCTTSSITNPTYVVEASTCCGLVEALWPVS